MQLLRRHWLRLAARTCQFLILAGLAGALQSLLRRAAPVWRPAAPRVDEQPEFVLRPPGALDEREFLARCIRCHLCQDVCPAGCIHMSLDGAVAGGTPLITPRVKGCTLCLRCAAVCPTGALRPLSTPEQVAMGVARVDESLCVSHLRTGVCGACYTACPLHGRAITQGLFNAPRVHAEFCVGCGMCEEVCIVPYRAIRVSPREPAARLATGILT